MIFQLRKFSSIRRSIQSVSPTRRVDYRRKFTGWHNFRAARCSPKKASPIFVSVARPIVEYPRKFINHRLRKCEGHRSIWQAISNSLQYYIFHVVIARHEFSQIRNIFLLRYVSWYASKNKFTQFLFLFQLL